MLQNKSDTNRLNKYMMSDNYSLTATALTLSASEVSLDLPWQLDSGATFSCTNDISDLRQPSQLLNPIPIKGADGTIIFATHVGSSYFNPRYQVYFVPRSAVKLVSLGVLSTLGYTVHTDKTRSIFSLTLKAPLFVLAQFSRTTHGFSQVSL